MNVVIMLRSRAIVIVRYISLNSTFVKGFKCIALGCHPACSSNSHVMEQLRFTNDDLNTYILFSNSDLYAVVIAFSRYGSNRTCFGKEGCQRAVRSITERIVPDNDGPWNRKGYVRLRPVPTIYLLYCVD